MQNEFFSMSLELIERRLVISHNTGCLLVRLRLFPIDIFHLARTYAIM